jgi:hypothetical protein
MGYFDERAYVEYPTIRPYTNPIAFLLFGVNLYINLSRIQWSWFSIIEFLSGLAFADFVVGMGHMLTDRMRIAEEHHIHPANMLKKNFWCRNAENTLLSLIFSLVFPCNVIYIASIIGSVNGDLHYWQHNYQNVPWILELFWKSGLLVDYKYHKLHHVDHRSHYTTVTAWSEPVINWIDRRLTKYDILNLRDRIVK